VDQEAASRVGVTSTAIARQLTGGVDGAAVSTFWEGSRAVDIVFRLGEGERQRFDDIAGAYITSDATGARVPLSEVATLAPEWGPSRIVRRNGVRTLTVLSYAAGGHLPSEVLARARTTLDTLTLPEGVRLEYGGESESQSDTQAEMMVALAVSLLLIFLILLVQFRSLRLPLVVMASIPLSVVGAVLGLIVTDNPFSFTAFLGLIGLMGLVVRNAIILVDYMNSRSPRAGRSSRRRSTPAAAGCARSS
jgi:multidrug efflux pump subunit AcrB